MEEKISGKEINELKEKSKKYAESAGIALNPNEKIVDGIIKGLLRNKEKNGELYCPCRMQTGLKEADKKIICPCAYHLKEIEEDGHCHCLLFVKK